MNDLYELWHEAKAAIELYWPDEATRAPTMAVLNLAEAGHVNARAIVDGAIADFTGCSCGDDEHCGDDDGSVEREQAKVRNALMRLRAAMGES
jgi:hypothetical protein